MHIIIYYQQHRIILTKVEEYVDLKQNYKKIGIFLNDAVIDYINQYCDNEIVRAKRKSKREKRYFQCCLCLCGAEKD